MIVRGGEGVFGNLGYNFIVLVLMNPQFQGSRSPMQGGQVPFYNPQK
jgi:hypothetical protein